MEDRQLGDPPDRFAQPTSGGLGLHRLAHLRRRLGARLHQVLLRRETRRYDYPGHRQLAHAHTIDVLDGTAQQRRWPGICATDHEGRLRTGLEEELINASRRVPGPLHRIKSFNR